ncbi:MAG TPA: TraR/DksA C4-type zinc finger protein [Abditibacteriaceae bacterium]|jgi:RNA polymerase-binding protein DksA
MPTRTTDKAADNKQNGRNQAPGKGKLSPSASNNASSANASSAPENDAKAKSKATKGPMTEKDLEHFQSLLLAERTRLEEEREQIRSRAGSVDGALPEEGEGGDDDTADLAAAMMDKEMDLSVEDEIEDMLGAIDHALQKIEDGTYGICDMSGQQIPKSRLEVIPWAALTVECQALAEGG